MKNLKITVNRKKIGLLVLSLRQIVKFDRECQKRMPNIFCRTFKSASNSKIALNLQNHIFR